MEVCSSSGYHGCVCKVEVTNIIFGIWSCRILFILCSTGKTEGTHTEIYLASPIEMHLPLELRVRLPRYIIWDWPGDGDWCLSLFSLNMIWNDVSLISLSSLSYCYCFILGTSWGNGDNTIASSSWLSTFIVTVDIIFTRKYGILVYSRTSL